MNRQAYALGCFQLKTAQPIEADRVRASRPVSRWISMFPILALILEASS